MNKPNRMDDTKRELFLQKLSELPDTRGPLMEPMGRKPLPNSLSHLNTVEMLNRLQPLFLSAAESPDLDAKERAAVIDMAGALGASPSLLEGWTTVKVDSPMGAITFRRCPLLPWRLWVRKNAPGGESSHLGCREYVLEAPPSGYCSCLRGWEISDVVQDVEDVLFCPGAEIRGAAYA